jgi:hypothetical protein
MTMQNNLSINNKKRGDMKKVLLAGVMVAWFVFLSVLI